MERWREGDRIRRGNSTVPEDQGTIVSMIGGVLVQLNSGGVLAGSVANLQRIGWHLQKPSYNPLKLSEADDYEQI